MKNEGIRNCVGVPPDVTSDGRLTTLRQTRRSAPTKYRRAKKTLHATSIPRNSKSERFPLSQRGLGGFSSNGRIYDPVTAQFMQADNYIQSPEDFISYNRYAYCLYNPFKYTDPSGEFWCGKEGETPVWHDQVDVVAYRYSTSNPFLMQPSFWGINQDYLRPSVPSICGSKSSGNGGGYNNSNESGNSTGSKDPNNRSKYEFYNPNTKQNILNDISHSDGRMLMTTKKTDGDPRTQNQNIDGTNFVGNNNAMTYDKCQDWNAPCYIQTDPPAKYHDRRYTNVGHWTGKQTGSLGFLLDTRMIGADFRFVVDELKVSQNPDVPHYIRDRARTYAFGIGVAAIPKTIFQFMKPFPLNIMEIEFYDNLSNINP